MSVFCQVGGSFCEVGEGQSKTFVSLWGNSNCSLLPIDNGVHRLQPWVSKDGIFFSSIHDVEVYLLSDVSYLDIDNGFIVTDDVGCLVSVSNGKGVL